MVVEVLGLDEAEVLPPRVAQNVAEQVDAAAAFAREVDVVDGVIHLGLEARARLEADHRGRRRPGTQLTEPLADRGVAAGETTLPQFIEEPHRGQIGITAQQFLEHRLVWIELPAAASGKAWRSSVPRIGPGPGPAPH